MKPGYIFSYFSDSSAVQRKSNYRLAVMISVLRGV